MIRYVRGAIAALALAGAAALPAPAAADFTPQPLGPWANPATCATGAFTGYAGGSGGQLSGWAQTCPEEKVGYPTGQQFGFAYFHWYDKGGTSGVVFQERLRTYTNPDGPTSFDGQLDAAAAREGSPDAMAICLMRDPDTRLACLSVSIPTFGSAVFAPLAVDDPIVTGPVTVRRPELDKDGNPVTGGCGTCL
jgi:hypothetical protein